MTKVKYPRTYHLPWSEGKTDDDKVLRSTQHFVGRNVVVTEKMDGENTTLYSHSIHARSVDSAHHVSRDWVKNYWQSLRYHIPEGYRICGENLFAKHSIHYTSLKSYFLGFSLWHDDMCLSWDETLEYFELLNVVPVNMVYRGIYNEDLIREIGLSLMSQDCVEGYVIRIVDSFTYDDFKVCVGKCVRSNHVQTDKHWSQEKVIPNRLV